MGKAGAPVADLLVDASPGTPLLLLLLVMALIRRMLLLPPLTPGAVATAVPTAAGNGTCSALIPVDQAMTGLHSVRPPRRHPTLPPPRHRRMAGHPLGHRLASQRWQAATWT